MSSKYGRRLTGTEVGHIKYILEETNYTSIKEIAEEYGVSPTMIAKIRDGKVWTRIKPENPKTTEGNE